MWAMGLWAERLGGGGVANFEACKCFLTGKGISKASVKTNKKPSGFHWRRPSGVGGYYYMMQIL